MLTQLHIENIAVIEKADISFCAGLCVLTGETGAGKSIIIDSINMLLGSRVNKDIIRSGCKKAYVSACFDQNFTPICYKLFNKFGLEIEEDGTILIQRELSIDGRSVARINGRQVTLSILKTIGCELITIHGQQDNQALLDASSHIKYLDAFAKNEQVLHSYQAAFKHVCKLKKSIETLNLDEQEKAHKLDLLQYQIHEIEQADIKIDEDNRLDAKRKILYNAEKITETFTFLNDLLSEGEYNIHDMLAQAKIKIREIASFSSEFEQIYDRYENLYEEMSDIIESLRDISESFHYDKAELDAIEDRLDLIRTLKRKYGQNISDINAYLDSAKREFAEISLSEKQLDKLEKELALAEINLIKEAENLTTARKEASELLKKQIIDELSFLEMKDVRFDVKITHKDPKSDGMDSVEFLLSSNIGEELKPLSEIASGGELSRIMLSIKNVLADADNIQTLIFDEIDTGVSGRAAQKIGMKLKDMSIKKQVIIITHLAQIASYANTHYLIEKNSDNQRTYTYIHILNEEEQVTELSRILGGIEITSAIRATAKEMLQKAKNQS